MPQITNTFMNNHLAIQFNSKSFINVPCCLVEAIIFAQYLTRRSIIYRYTEALKVFGCGIVHEQRCAPLVMLSSQQLTKKRQFCTDACMNGFQATPQDFKTKARREGKYNDILNSK
jgi:hypothetical protein